MEEDSGEDIVSPKCIATSSSPTAPLLPASRDGGSFQKAAGPGGDGGGGGVAQQPCNHPFSSRAGILEEQAEDRSGRQRCFGRSLPSGFCCAGVRTPFHALQVPPTGCWGCIGLPTAHLVQPTHPGKTEPAWGRTPHPGEPERTSHSEQLQSSDGGGGGTGIFPNLPNVGRMHSW